MKETINPFKKEMIMNNLPKEVLPLYKECLIKAKNRILVNVVNTQGKEKKVRLTDLPRGVQNVIMGSLHEQALAGKHI
jgi:hypothetical protein